jgi:hypothetical protein
VVDLLLGQRSRSVPESRKDRVLRPPRLECLSGPAEVRESGFRIEFEDDLRLVFAVPLDGPETAAAFGSTEQDAGVDSAHDRGASKNGVAVLRHPTLPSVMDKEDVGADVSGNPNQRLKGPADDRVVVEVLCANQGLERVHDDQDRAFALGRALQLCDSVFGARANDQSKGFFAGRAHRSEVPADFVSFLLERQVEDRTPCGFPAEPRFTARDG